MNRERECKRCKKIRRITARELCDQCYRLVTKAGQRDDYPTTKTIKDKGPCVVAGCDQQSYAKRLCGKHYHKQHRKKIGSGYTRIKTEEGRAIDLASVRHELLRAQELYDLSVGLEAQRRWSRRITLIKERISRLQKRKRK